jgi:hypothetical protein
MISLCLVEQRLCQYTVLVVLPSPQDQAKQPLTPRWTAADAGAAPMPTPRPAVATEAAAKTAARVRRLA